MNKFPISSLYAAARVVALASTAVATLPCLAQDAYPSRPIRLIVGLQAGGVTDLVARRVGVELGAVLGQSVVVENVAGAGGNIATGTVAHAKPDGYTLQLGTTSTNILAPMMQASEGSAPQEPVVPNVPIAVIGVAPLAIFAHPQADADTASKLVALIKANPGKYSYGSAGVGSTSHLSGELFKLASGGLDATHIPYKGGPAEDMAVVTGEVLYAFDAPGSIIPLDKAGRVKILAVLADKRIGVMPDVPTSKEAGLGDLKAGVTYYVFAPPQTPAAVITKVRDALATAYGNDAYRADLSRNGVEPGQPGSPSAAAVYLDKERKSWQEVIEKQKVKL